MQVGQGVRNVSDLFYAVIGEDECGELVEKGEVIEFADLVVTEVDTFKEIECSAHVFDLRQLVPSKVELSLVQRIGELL